MIDRVPRPMIVKKQNVRANVRLADGQLRCEPAVKLLNAVTQLDSLKSYIIHCDKGRVSASVVYTHLHANTHT
jgi:hypothetical protein